MRRRNGFTQRGFTPTAELLEGRRLLTALPLPRTDSLAGFSRELYFLESAGSSRWTVQNRNATSNGLPAGGKRIEAPGLGIFGASYDGTHGGAFNFGHSIWVDDSIFVPPGGPGFPDGQVEIDGYDDANEREHLTRLSAGPSPMSGLGVSVEYYAAQQSATLRTLVRLDNAGAAPVSTNVTFAYNLGSDSTTTITGTSSGGFAFTAGDRWIVTDDLPPGDNGDQPAVTAVLRGPGPGALAPSAVSNVVFDAGADNDIRTEGVLATYDVTVPANETRYLMFFTQLGPTSAGALDSVQAFDTAPTLTRTPFWNDLLTGVDDAQYRQVLNWASNTPPVAAPEAYTTDEDTALHVPALDVPGVLANDSDADGDAITAVIETRPAHGTLDLQPDGSFAYQPTHDYFGTGAEADHFTYRAKDSRGALSELTTVTIDVNPVNDAPVADAGANVTADEGSAVTFAGSATDVDDAPSALTYHWDFGDNSSAERAGAMHAYVDNGTYTAALTVTDAQGASSTDVLVVTVANVAPAATIAGAPGDVIAEGTVVNLTAGVVDPGTADTHTVEWTVTRGGNAFAAGTGRAFAFTPDDDGEYLVALTVTDKDGSVGTDTHTVVVVNVKPVATISGAPEGAILEGTAVSMAAGVVDPGTADTHSYKWTVSRGGEVLFAGTDRTFSFTPTDEGQYVVALTVTDDDGGVGTDTRTVVVANAAPTFAGVSFSTAAVNENETAHLSGHVADVGAGDALTVAVDWADGSPVTVVNLAAGSSFDLPHQYLDDPAGTAADSYAVTVTLTDGDGGAATAPAAVTVNNVDPVVRAVAGPASGAPGQTLSYSTSFTDAGTLDTHAATVDWGDGTAASPAALTEPAGDVAGSTSADHAYASPGLYTVTFTVRDDDGGASQSATVVSVVAVNVTPVELRPDPTYSGKMSLYVLGTPGNDSVQINPSSQSGAVEVVLNGVNYGPFAPKGRIVVYAGAGDDSVQEAGAVSIRTWVYGEDGNDSLNLGNGGGIVFGGAGNDQINGGTGRDILLGGEGADRIVSNPGDDILVSAVTVYDNRFAAGHDGAWRAIYSEWASTVRTFRQRVDNLRCGGGTSTRANGSYFLNDSTIDDDLAVDTIGTQDVLTGASGEDWFIYKAGEDKISSMTSTEATEDLLIT
jgi:VCBS repeat-containing protein